MLLKIILTDCLGSYWIHKQGLNLTVPKITSQQNASLFKRNEMLCQRYLWQATAKLWHLFNDRPISLGLPPQSDGWTDGKISRTQEMLHSCQSRNDQKPIWKSLTRFFRKRSILKDLLVSEGRVDGIASAKLRGRVAAAEASGFGIDLLTIMMWAEVGIISWNIKSKLFFAAFDKWNTYMGGFIGIQENIARGKGHEFPLIWQNLAKHQKNEKIILWVERLRWEKLEVKRRSWMRWRGDVPCSSHRALFSLTGSLLPCWGLVHLFALSWGLLHLGTTISVVSWKKQQHH